MPKTVYKESGSGRFCNLAISSLEVGPEAIVALEMSPTGALIDLKEGVLTVNEYVDIALDLGGGVHENLFGHVLDVAGSRVVMRFLYFDPSEEARLREVMGVALDGNPRAEKVENAESPEERFAVEEEARRLAGTEQPKSSRSKTAPGSSRKTPSGTYEASDAQHASGVAKAQTTKREGKPARKPRKGAVLPSSPRNEAVKPRGENKPLTSRTVRGIPDGDDAGKALTDAIKAQKEEKARRRSTAGNGERKPGKTRQVVRPSKDAKPQLPTPSPAEGDSGRKSGRVVIKPTKGSRPQLAPAEKEPTPRKVVKPSTGSTPDELPVPELDAKPEKTRRVIKPRRMKVSEMPTLAHPADESGDAIPAGPAIELIDKAVAEAEAQEAEAREAEATAKAASRRPRRPRDAVSQRILAKTRKMDLSRLAAKQKTVRVVNLETIKSLIQDAVDEVVGSMSPVEVLDEEAVAKAVEEKVAERLQSSEDEKRDLEAKARGLEVQLKAAQRALDQEREREISATNFTVSADGLEDLEKHFNRLVQHAIRANGVNDVLSAELERMVSTLLDKEREKIAEKALKAHEGKMGMLQKQIDRLARSLEDTESERDLNLKRLKIMEAKGGGLTNIMEAGLDLEDPDAEKKKELLKEIFEQNKQLREEYKAAHGGELPDQSKRAQERAEVERKAQEAIDELKAEQDAREAREAEAEDAGDAGADEDDPYADMTNPDDEIWEGPPAGDADGAEAEEDPYADMVDPDDMIWEGPSSTFEQEQAAKGQGDIKLMTDYTNFEPPPLEKKKD